MKVVDPKKLGPYREMIDADVAAISLTENITLAKATLKYAAEELGKKLIVRGAWSRWWSCLPISISSFGSPRPKRHEMSSDEILKQARLVAKFVSTNTVVARTPDAAATAAICQVIEPSVEIFLSDEQFEALYGRDAVDDVVSCLPFQMAPSDLDASRILFESEPEYFERLFGIITHYYTLTEARRSFDFILTSDD